MRCAVGTLIQIRIDCSTPSMMRQMTVWLTINLHYGESSACELSAVKTIVESPTRLLLLMSTDVVPTNWTT